ncbi:MAG: fibronectin type III domain protein [Candidatus Ozemobacter sibiricus]|uniref:Fibronectin type III domain protein n=1 Tax=Candidatus Ozemobacter sibiricus TaxID=2268124 RepID=A0A367ZL98_9BACT|nr:MAG: fibronectin type III domain protein [Candidatus Ozemobacter sibiricus]
MRWCRTILVGLVVFWGILMTKWGAEAASFKVTSNADFIAPGATLQGVVASDTGGNPAGYVRLFNTNPGVDDPANPSWRFTDGGTRTWTKRRRIALTVPPEPGGARASRTNEKVNVEIGIIGGANANWSDLRLTNALGAPVPFRLRGYETPVDNPNTPVKILFEATANPLPPAGTPVNYWLYYGNPEALSVATTSISPFYLRNHDFENGMNHWGIGFVTGPTTAYFYGIENNNSYLPEGFPGYENKSCFLVCYPEGQTVNVGWLGASQTVDLPGTGTYVLNVFGKTLTSGLDDTGGITSRIFLLDQDGNNWEEFRIPAGISEWNLMTVTRQTNRLRLTAITALNHNSNKTGAGWRERRINYDWVELLPKYPLSVYLDDEIDAGYQRVATYISRPFDTGEVSPTFEAITWSANTSGNGTSIEFFTRTGATQAACTSAPWSSAITVNGGAVPLPHARWIQFMARLKTSDTGFTPLLEEVEIFFSLPTKSLAIQAPTPVKAGSFFEFSVTALDGTLATATRSTTAFTLSSPSPTATFPVPAYTFQTADQGSRAFQGRQTTAGVFTVYASATVGGVASGAATITCLPDETAKLWFEGLPTTITAGQPVTGFVRARDKYGNLNTADTATLFFTCTDPYPASFSATRQLLGGQIALTNMAFYTVSTQTLTVIDNLRGLTASHTFTVLPATPVALGLNASPVQYQGLPFPLTVDVLDAFGNIVPTYNGPFTLGVSSGTVTPNAGTFASGTATIYPALTQLGNLTLTATDPTPLQGQLSVGCYQLPPPSFDGYGVDAGFVQLAGVPFILTITARDFGGNTLTSYKGACRIIPSVGEAIPSVSSGYSFLDGVLALSVTLTGASDAVTLRVEDIGDSTKFGSVILNVKPGGVERFDLITPPAATAGASLTFEVRAVDSGGNLVSNYTGTIMLTHDATGGDPSLPSVYTFTLADKGRRVFSGSQAARFTKAETVRLKVEDSGRFGLSAPIVILADSTKPRLTISPAVLTIPVGTPFTFDVALQDPFLNPLRNYTGTIGLGYSNLATGPSGYTFAAFEDGYHRFFLAASATTLGPFRIFATETSTLATAASEIITAVSDRTTNFLVRRTDFPGSTLATAGEKVYFQVTASDSSGNLNVDYLGNVRFSSGDPAAQLPLDSNLTNGLGGFEATFFTAGHHILYVRDVADPSILGTHTFSVRPAAPSRFRFTFPTSRTRVGIFLPAWSYSLQVVDAYGNLASITGSVSVSSTDTGGRPPQLYTLTNQSVINDTWWFASAGVQLLIATSTLLPTAYSEPILASAGPPASITFQGPRTVSNEFYFPFLVKIVDAFGNPTALATNTITPWGTCQTSWDANPTNYTLSPEDNGTKLFNIRWQMNDTTAPGSYPGRFSYPGLTDYNFQVFVDNPRHSSGGSQTLSLLKLSAPDRPVIASEPFRIVLTGNTVRDNAASFSGLIDFSITDGQIFVSSGTVPTAWNEYRSTLSIPLPGTTQLTLWAYATRSGYQTMVARLRSEPLKQGSVSFVVQSNPIIRRATLTADSPQKAKIPFPFRLEWWDLFDNYAENAIGRFIMNASTTGAFMIAPAHLLVGGRGGKFDTASNTEWFETKFQIASSMTDVHNDLVLGQLRLRGIYDEDFTDNSLDNGLWNPTIVNCGASGQAVGQYSWENQLKIWTLGMGELYTNVGNGTENQDDACSMLSFDWPSNDTAPFTMQLRVNRTMYDVVQRSNDWSVGLILREGHPAIARPRYIALQMRNGLDGTINNALRGYCTHRNIPGGTATRLQIPNQTYNLHPKWLELRYDGVNTWQGGWSNDLTNYRWFNAVTFAATNEPAFTENFSAASLDPRWSTWLGIGAVADIGTTGQVTPGAGNLCPFVFDRTYAGGNATGQNLQGSFRVSNAANNYRVYGYLVDINGRIATGPPLPSATTWYNNTNLTSRSIAINATNFPGAPGFDITRVRYFGWLVETQGAFNVEIDDIILPSFSLPQGFTPGNLKIGIYAVANSNTYPGGGWISELRIDRYPPIGTFTSVVYDAGSITTSIGPMTLTTTTPGNTRVRVYARASNDPGALPGWTYFGQTSTVNLASLAGNRYFQYALELVGDGPVPGIFNRTPTVQDVRIPYAVTGTGATFNRREIVTMIASSSPAPAVVATIPIEIRGGTVADLRITAPASTTAGQAFTITVAALDEAGNVADDATGTLVFGSNDGDPFPAQVPKPYTLIPSVDKGQHVFYNAVVLKNAIINSLASITVTDSVVASWTGVVVNPGPIDSFIASAATPQVASVFFPVFFEARDAFANRKTDYSASATFYDNKTGGSSYYAPPTLGSASWVQGVATLTPGAAFTKAHTVNVSIQSSNRTGISNPIEIIGGPAYSLQVLTTTNQPESGSPFDLTVTALDYFGNVAPAYTGTVQITSTDQHPARELPPPYTFQPSDKGTKTFTNLKLITPGVVTLTAADMAVPTLRKDYPVTVLPGKVARFDVSCTSPQTAGVPFNTLITAYDAFGYLKTNYSGSVTLGGSFTTIIPDAAISGFSNGQLLVPSTVLNHGTIPHSGWLVASQGTAIGTRSVQLLPPSGVFDHFFIETIPATPTAGDAFKMVVKAVGPNGAVYTAYAPTSVVLLTASNAAGLPVVPALTPSSITNFEIGVKEVYAHLWEAGTITLWAYDPVLSKVGSRTITVLPSTLAYFTVTPATSTVEPHPNHSYQVVGGSFPLIIKAYDSIDNFKDTYSGTVTLTHNGGGTLSVTQAQIVNGAATVLLNYDAPGIINIFARDTVFDKTGASKHIRFFGPLASFLVEADTDQTHNSPFMAQLTALDSWGQIKLNTLTGVGVTAVAWQGPPPVPVVTPTLFDPLTWNLGKTLTELNVDCHNDNGTFTIRFTSTSGPTASGEIQLQMHTQATVVTQIRFEFFSPQKAGEPFFFRVRGCDANNAVVPGWHRDVEITANPFQEVHPSFVAESAFSEGAWATTTARMYVPGDYFILASSTNMAGIPITGSRFIRIEPGPLAGFRFRFPPSWNSTGKTKLFLPFTMAVEAISGDGSVKTDYEPAGNLLLKLNATATGFLGVTSIPPGDFVNGVATISNQTYNKSQVILMRTSDPETGLTSTSGPLTVHGDAAKFAIEILPPGKGSAGDPILWRNFFQVRLTAQDVNNFPVSDYTGTVAFSMVPGALPTPATSSIFAPYHLQVFPLNANAQATFTLKVDYDESYTYPVHLRLKASDTISGPARITPDLVFDKQEAFDHWEFVSPSVGQKLTKGKYFPMFIRSVSNYGNDWPTFATPVLSYRVLSPASGLTNFTAEPPHWTFLPFGGAGNYATSAMIMYDEKASSSILLRLDEGSTQEASVTVEVHPVYGPTVGSGTVFQEIATTTFPAVPQAPGRFILSTYVCPGSGAATLGLGYHADDGSQTDFQGVTIDANGSLFSSGSIAEAGITDRFSFHDPDNPGQLLTWYRIYVAVDAVFDPDAASRTYLILKNASPDTASHSVWFDGVQVEKALFPDQTVPTTFGSSRKVVSPNTGLDLMGRSRYYQW